MDNLDDEPVPFIEGMTDADYRAARDAYERSGDPDEVESETTINLGSPDEPFTVKVSRLTIGCAIEWHEPINGLYIPPEAERLIALAICPELAQ